MAIMMNSACCNDLKPANVQSRYTQPDDHSCGLLPCIVRHHIPSPLLLQLLLVPVNSSLKTYPLVGVGDWAGIIFMDMDRRVQYHQPDQSTLASRDFSNLDAVL